MSPALVTQAAKAVGFTPAWGRRLLHRWNEQGPDGLADRLTDQELRDLLTYLASRK